MLNRKTILITGGTGSFGQSFVRFVLTHFKPHKLIVFSRDELKQFKMQQEYLPSPKYDDILRFFLGDIRDLARLERALKGVDIVIHAAALKQVPTLEYNPIEAIQTNIIGTQNVINASINQGVKKVLLLSTDKCVQPINLYGATKLCAEKLFIASNAYALRQTVFSTMRYGNVMGSRGSIIETILGQDAAAPVLITHKDMTRFWLTLEQCFELLMHALKSMIGGEIFIPKAPSMKLLDLCEAIVPGRKKVFIGVRPGEKIHETLLTAEEATRSFDLGSYFVVLPNCFMLPQHEKYKRKGRSLKEGFAYTSDTNQTWLDSKKVLQILKKYDSLWSSNNKQG